MYSNRKELYINKIKKIDMVGSDNENIVHNVIPESIRNIISWSRSEI